MNKIIFISLFFLISFLTYSEEMIERKHLFSFKCDKPEYRFEPPLTENFIVFNAYIYSDLNPEVDKNIFALEKANAAIKVFWKDERVKSTYFGNLYYGINRYEIVDDSEIQFQYPDLGTYRRHFAPLNLSQIVINRTTLDAEWTIYLNNFTPVKRPLKKSNYTTKCEIVDSGYAQKWEKSVNEFIDKEKERKMKEETKKILDERKI